MLILKRERITRARRTSLPLILGLIILTSACGGADPVEIPAVGDIVVKSYDLSGFDQVEVGGFFEVEIAQGESYRVVVAAERALLPYLEVRVRGRRLQVELKPGIQYSFEDASQRVTVTLPALTRARISNHSALYLTGLTVEETLRLEAADFGTVRGSIEARKVQVEVSNHSSLVLTGSASQVIGDVTDLSSVDLTGLNAAEVNIDTDTHSSLVQ